MPLKHLVIGGDAPFDLFISPSAAEHTVDEERKKWPRASWFRGGAGLLTDLLNGSNQSTPNLHIHHPSFGPLGHGDIRSIVELNLHSPNFTSKRQQRLKAESKWYPPNTIPPDNDSDACSLYLFQDAEAPFDDNDSKAAILHFSQMRPRFLIYHMTRPLCTGRIWEKFRRGPFISHREQDPKRVIVIVQADDLRAEGIELSYGLSWEKTCEDFVEQLGSVGRLVTLTTCAHLIVLFGCDGVIYHRGWSVSKPVLFFDPLRAEGDFLRQNLGCVPGVAEAFVARFAKSLVLEDEIERSIESGFWAARRLVRRGLSMHGQEPPIYHVHDIMDSKRKDIEEKLIRFSIPSDDIGQGRVGDWSLLDYLVGDPAEVARRIVTKGMYSSVNEVPLARFNHLVLFDRREIELFRTLFNSLIEYLAVPQTRPLNIALFGPKGSGKSYAALQVAETASRGKKVRQLRFDISQFTHIDELQSAFRSVRDCTLEGYIPLVYFDGFDADLNGSQFGWLSHLLAPISRGIFSDGHVSRPLGSGVFFFGATVVKTYEDFRRRVEKHMRLPRDFLGCLHGFVDMVGPDRKNHGHEIDRLYPVRRAVILRALLEQREPNLKSGDSISIDERVMNGLLLVPSYRQGIRSLKSIVAMSRLNNHRHFERAALPPQAQLNLHVDYHAFMRHMDGLPVDESIREDLAEKLHNEYCADRRRHGTPEEDLHQWKELDEEFKESSRAHADCIPQKLRLINCFLAETQGHRKAVPEFTKAEVEVLAINEHDRWNTERLRKQWRAGERDSARRTSPFLVPWEDLSKDVKEIDRALVRSYPRILPKGWEIYRMGPRDNSVLGWSE
jgi:hypothetical protein